MMRSLPKHMTDVCACGRPMTSGRGRCLECYRQSRQPSRETLESRIWARIEPTGDGCWNWTGQVSPRGYGQFFIDGRNRPAHRTAYEFAVGPIPDGLQIDHLCRNRRCINPAHLEPVTSRENTLRGVSPSAVCAAKTSCRFGHPLDGVRGRQRYCRTCVNEANRRRRAQRNGRAAIEATR